MSDFLLVLLTCSASVSFIAVVFYFISPILSVKHNANSLYLVWLIIFIAFAIPIRPIFDYKSYIPIYPVLTTQDNLNGYSAFQTITSEPLARFSVGYLISSNYRWIIYTWALGCFIVAVFHIIRYIYFVKRISRSVREAGVSAISILNKLSGEMGISKKIHVQVSALIVDPLLLGFLHPQILLPTSDFTDEELALIIKHELVHYQRKDLWHKVLVLVAYAMHWFNPIVYLAGRTFNTLCKLSCDEISPHGLNGSVLQKHEVALKKYGKRAKVGIALLTACCIVLTEAMAFGYLTPSVRYLERQWRANASLNEREYKKEPEKATDAAAEYPFMGAVQISYFFDKSHEYPNLQGAGDVQARVSVYDTVVMKGISLSDQKAVDALADQQLNLIYQKDAGKGHSNKNPKPPKYAYVLELPKDLSGYEIEDFLIDQKGTPQISEIGYEASYRQDGATITIKIPPQHPDMPSAYLETKDTEALAIEEIEKEAKEMGMELPENFQDDIIIYHAS